MKRLTACLVGAAALALAATTVATARPAASASCKSPTIGIIGPITGPVASVGDDQLHWARFAVAAFNKANPSMKVHMVEGDSQLDPSKSSVIAQQFSSNKQMLAIVGPSGSQEVVADAPILKKAGLAFVSSSATNVSLTDGSNRGYFFRVVPNDGNQGPTDVRYLMEHLGVKPGSTVMDIDNQNTYSTGLSDIIDAGLRAKGVTVDRESIASTATDYSSLIGKITPQVKAVVLTWQVAGNAQLFAQQMQAQGKQTTLFGTDGVYDSSKFTANGAYISFFAPDVATVPGAKAVVDAFRKQYGDPGPFGAPTYVAAQVVMDAIQAVCKKTGTATRASVRAQIAKTKLKTSILGDAIAFTRNGDLKGAHFFVFKIVNGKYVTVGG